MNINSKRKYIVDVYMVENIMVMSICVYSNLLVGE